MATDSTGLKVLVPKLPAAHDGYLELYRNRDCAVFQYEPDKGGERVAAKLKPFRGTLTADAEHRFSDVYLSGSVIEEGCNAHGRRKLRDAEDTQPALAAECGAFVAAIYAEEERAQKLAHRRGPGGPPSPPHSPHHRAARAMARRRRADTASLRAAESGLKPAS